MHRKGKASQYTWENVAIVPGGRAGLIRIAAVLNNAYVGFFIPDYTGTFPRLELRVAERLTGVSVQRNALAVQERMSLTPYPWTMTGDPY
jgi:hypothetical protein